MIAESYFDRRFIRFDRFRRGHGNLDGCRPPSMQYAGQEPHHCGECAEQEARQDEHVQSDDNPHGERIGIRLLCANGAKRLEQCYRAEQGNSDHDHGEPE